MKSQLDQIDTDNVSNKERIRRNIVRILAKHYPNVENQLMTGKLEPETEAQIEEFQKTLEEIYMKILAVNYSDETSEEINKQRERLYRNGAEYLKKFKYKYFSTWHFHSVLTMLSITQAKEHYLRRLNLPANQDLALTRRHFRDRGLEPYVFERVSLEVVIDAIRMEVPVDGVDIVEKIKNPKFRFITKDNPIFSANVSEAFAVTIGAARSVELDIQKKGVAKLKENADDFARAMHDKIKILQREEKVTSFRETVKLLNERNIPSYRGGKWHVNTLQQLNKRWKEMNLPEIGVIPD